MFKSILFGGEVVTYRLMLFSYVDVEEADLR